MNTDQSQLNGISSDEIALLQISFWLSDGGVCAIANVACYTWIHETEKAKQAKQCLKETVTCLPKIDSQGLWNLFSWPGLSNPCFWF